MRMFRYRAVLVIIAIMIAAGAVARPVSQEEANRAAHNFLSFKSANGTWNGQVEMTATLVRTIQTSDGTPAAYYFEVEPQGCVLISGWTELPVVKAYSTTTRMSFDHDQTAGTMFSEMMRQKVRLLQSHTTDASLAAAGVNLNDVTQTRALWDLYSLPAGEYAAELAARELDDYTPGTVLLESAWHQEAPYNNFTPIEETENCKVGCVATATAQIMKYWNWPVAGQSGHSYLWHGQYISATFSDTYDWDNILMEYGQPWQHTPAEMNAVAELNFEVGVAYEMNYGVDASGAYTSDCITILPQYFRYEPGIDEEDRAGYANNQEWFDMLCAEIDQERPMLYSIYNDDWGHAIVVDGWQIETDINQLHINYGGWVGIFLGWYAVDGIPGADYPNMESCYRYIQPDADAPPPDPAVLTLTPHQQPLVLVPQGGSFFYNLAVSSNVGIGGYGWIWSEATLPGGSTYGPIFSEQLYFFPYMNAYVPNLEQAVPVFADIGYYVWNVHLGLNPNTPLVSDEFAFMVMAPEPGYAAGGAESWIADGADRIAGAVGKATEELPSSEVEEPALPMEFGVIASPNPFNAVATITVNLPEATDLQMRVVNVNGRVVDELAGGTYAAGEHRIAFEARSLSSGIYFVHTIAGGKYRDVSKVMLVR